MKVLKIKNSNFENFLEENLLNLEDFATLCETLDFIYLELNPDMGVFDLKFVETELDSYEVMFEECNKNKDYFDI